MGNICSDCSRRSRKHKAATDKVQAAADEAKKMIEEASKQKNPMKAAKAAKTAKAATAVVEFGNTATPI